MKIKLKNYARQLWLSLLLMVGVAAIAVPELNGTNSGNVAKIGNTEYETLQEAFYVAKNGQTVTLLDDVDATGNMYAGDTRYNLWVKSDITVDGDGHTLTVKGRGIGVKGASGNIDVTFKDLTIENKSSGARCIDTRGKIGSLTLEGVTLSTDGAPSGYTQPLTIGGSQADVATVNITNSTIQTNDAGTAYYAIITFNPVNMTISNSTLKGWACIYAKDPDSSAGSEGSVFTLDNCTLVSNNNNKGESNTFGAIQINDDNVTVNVTNTNITIQNKYDPKQGLACISSIDKDLNPATYTGSKITLGEGNTVTFNNMEGATGSCEYIVNQGDNTFEISGGTFNADPSNYLAEGFKAVESNGTWTVQRISYVAQIGEGENVVKYETLDDAVAAVPDNGAEPTLITILCDVENGNGIKTVAAHPKNVVIDFDGHSYRVGKGLVGS